MSQTPADFQQIQEYFFLPGNLYLTKGSVDKILIATVGDILSEGDYKKFSKDQKRFFLDTKVNPNNIVETTKYLQLLHDAFSEVDHLNWRSDFLRWIKKSYLDDKSNSSFLDLMISFRQHLLKIPTHVEQTFTQSALSLYVRSSATATLATIGSIALGILDYNFLEKIYNNILMLDFNLVSDGANYNTLKLLADNQSYSILKKHNDATIVNNFLSHVTSENPPPQLDLKLYKRVLKIHHEKIDGSGFPSGLIQEELTTLEEIILYSLDIAPFASWKNSDTATSNLIKKLFGKSNEHCRISKYLGEIINDLPTKHYEVFLEDAS